MTGRDDDDPDEGWQARTHVIRVQPQARAKSTGTDCLVVIYSRDTAQLGKRFVLDNNIKATVGRGADNTIVLESDTASRRHARFERRGEEWWVMDEHSTNGTYVNDELVQAVGLRRGDHVMVGDTIFKYLAGHDVEAAYHEEIYRMTIVDGLTKAHNRRYLTEQIEKELSRARRHHRPLGLVMLDIDKFKRINDTYGHLAGDYVLRELANVVRNNVPSDVVFARYGGEEFSLLMMETELRRVWELTEGLRAAVEKHAFTFEGTRIAVTISMGIAMLAEGMAVPDELIKAADTLLYKAKQDGRNRVVY